MKPARYMKSLGNREMVCLLCPHACYLKPGETGRCGARRNSGGLPVAAGYGKITSLALDPVEKKPLRNFYPGARILSVGSYGCNMRCPFCQNHEISMGEPSARDISPEALAELSLSLAGESNIGVAFTYNEPVVGYEYVLDCAALVRAQGQRNVLVTNGLINREPLGELVPLIDAMNIDLKGFRPETYKALGGELATVQNTIRQVASRCHLEVTTLIVPGENDDPREMEALAAWLAAVDPRIPLHISRFFPRYLLSGRQPTPLEEIRRLAAVARGHLNNVYTGNC